MISKVGIKKAKVFPEPVQAWPLDSLDHGKTMGKALGKHGNLGNQLLGIMFRWNFGGPTLTKKNAPGKSPSQTNTARLHRDISLLQQQGDGDGLHWRHPLEAHLRNEALCALQRHEV